MNLRTSLQQMRPAASVLAIGLLCLPPLVAAIAAFQRIAIAIGAFDPIRDDHISPASLPLLIRALHRAIIGFGLATLVSVPVQWWLIRRLKKPVSDADSSLYLTK